MAVATDGAARGSHGALFPRASPGPVRAGEGTLLDRALDLERLLAAASDRRTYTVLKQFSMMRTPKMLPAMMADRSQILGHSDVSFTVCLVGGSEGGGGKFCFLSFQYF